MQCAKSPSFELTILVAYNIVTCSDGGTNFYFGQVTDLKIKP